ncbi:MAG: HRDC domain-containing protein [Actinomycetia bacterium]|nr:HRDC domain-containing protein [Actinomycetes bacterium]
MSAGRRPQGGATDAALFEELRVLRREVVAREHLPPHMIFHDASLQEMATVRPGTPGELLEINGVGEKKLERYGVSSLSGSDVHNTRKSLGLDRARCRPVPRTRPAAGLHREGEAPEAHPGLLEMIEPGPFEVPGAGHGDLVFPAKQGRDD